MSMKLNAERGHGMFDHMADDHVDPKYVKERVDKNTLRRKREEKTLDVWRQMAKTQMSPMGPFVNEPYRPLRNSPCVLKTMQERYPPREPANDTDLLRGAW